MAQVSSRYGRRASTIVNNHRAKVFGTGISDAETLNYVSRVLGQGVRAALAHRPASAAEARRPRATPTATWLPPTWSASADPGTGLLVYGHLPPAKIRLRPWYEDEELRRLREGRDAEGVER